MTQRGVSISALFLFLTWAVLALLYNPLVDFWPNVTAFHAFVERRILLVSILPWILVSSMFLILFYYPSCSRFPLFFLLSLALTLLPAVFISPIKTYAFVEAGLYFFFFAVIVWWGQVIAVTGIVNKAVEIMLFLTAVSLLLYAVICIYMLFFSLMDRVVNLGTILPWGFINIRYWSHLATWFIPLLPLTILCLSLGKHRLWRVGIVFSGGVWWWIVFLSTARGSFISIAVSTVVVVLLFRREAWEWLRWMLVFMCAGILIWWIVAFMVPWMFDLPVMQKSLGFSSSGRLLLWKEAWEMSVQNFPFGMGVFSWIIHEPLGEWHKKMGIFGHPHNMYLFWAAEYGWIMIFMLMCFTFAFIRKWCFFRKVCNDQSAQLSLLGLTASVFSALVHSLFSSVFLMPASMLVGLVIMSTFWGVVNVCSAKGNVFFDFPTRLLLKIIVVLIFVFLGFIWQFVVYKNYVEIERDINTEGLYIPGHGLIRFWDNSHVPYVGTL